VIVKEFSPAKINLFLHVTGERDDGYHELYTLMTCLDFGDDLEFDFTGSGVTVVCDHPDVPEDDSNLVYRAVELFMDRYLKKGSWVKKELGVCVTICKQIPMGAGLGGGSSNAAVTLKVLNQKFNHFFSKQELMDMGLALGADVPFFIHGGPAFARGVGERLSSCPQLLPYHVVVYFPGFAALTPLVYENVNLALTNEKKTNNNALLNMSEINQMLDGQILDVKGFLHNDLELAACKIYPDLVRVREKMAEFKPDGLLMTGSGSSYFALFSEASKANEALKMLSKETADKTENNQGSLFMASFLKF
jgi:4-diphosphocytidyl-2-C-methyl-D-erythritol kinase